MEKHLICTKGNLIFSKNEVASSKSEL